MNKSLIIFSLLILVFELSAQEFDSIGYNPKSIWYDRLNSIEAVQNQEKLFTTEQIRALRIVVRDDSDWRVRRLASQLITEGTNEELVEEREKRIENLKRTNFPVIGYNGSETARQRIATLSNYKGKERELTVEQLEVLRKIKEVEMSPEVIRLSDILLANSQVGGCRVEKSDVVSFSGLDLLEEKVVASLLTEKMSAFFDCVTTEDFWAANEEYGHGKFGTANGIYRHCLRKTSTPSYCINDSFFKMSLLYKTGIKCTQSLDISDNLFGANSSDYFFKPNSKTKREIEEGIKSVKVNMLGHSTVFLPVTKADCLCI